MTTKDEIRREMRERRRAVTAAEPHDITLTAAVDDSLADRAMQ